MTKYNDLISIVVPIYNVDRYLEKCIDSIVKQTYTNLEIILVDDGSTDSCPEICDKYKEKDSRIIVIHKKNGGLSDARNSGILIAKGKYICFIDSDDCVALNYVERLYEKILTKKCDIAVCSYDKVYDTVETFKQIHTGSEIIFDNIEAIKDLFECDSFMGPMAWNKMYLTSLFRNHEILYPYGKINEDNFTTYKLFFHSKRIVYFDESLYFYMQRTDSITGLEFNEKRLDILQCLDETSLFLKSNEIDLSKEFISYDFMIRFNLVNSIILADLWEMKYDQVLIAPMKKNLKKVKKNIKTKYKCAFFMLSHSYHLYYFLLRKMRLKSK